MIYINPYSDDLIGVEIEKTDKNGNLIKSERHEYYTELDTCLLKISVSNEPDNYMYVRCSHIAKPEGPAWEISTIFPFDEDQDKVKPLPFITYQRSKHHFHPDWCSEYAPILEIWAHKEFSIEKISE